MILASIGSLQCALFQFVCDGRVRREEDCIARLVVDWIVKLSSDTQSKMVVFKRSFTLTLKTRHNGIHGVQKRVARLKTSASRIAHTAHARAFRISCFSCLNLIGADQQTFN